MPVKQRWLLCLVVLACAVAPGRLPVAADMASDRIASGLPPEVRIRKMHLVRPDLIPYPIAMEVYC